jgi:hypothetical protein
MCDVSCETEAKPRKSIKQRAVDRRDKLRTELRDVEAFIEHIEAHPETTPHLETASRLF